VAERRTPHDLRLHRLRALERSTELAHRRAAGQQVYALADQRGAAASRTPLRLAGEFVNAAAQQRKLKLWCLTCERRNAA